MMIFGKLARILGIDRSIFYTSLGRIIQAGGGIVSIFFIARYLSETEQGFYYTFGSIVAIQVFFELGLNGIITQYVAHETSNLKWKDAISLEGEERYLSRLSSLLHFSVKWYLIFAIILLVTLIGTGFIFFTKYQDIELTVTWKIPWMLLAIGASLNFLVAPILAFIEGLGKVKEVAKIRLYQQVIGLIVVWGSLLVGAKLFTLGINWGIGVIIVVNLLIYSNFRYILINIWNYPITEKVNYKREIFPYQWKIALSWISGYFIFQLFNPVLFATEGAIVAGQMGMTLAALNGIQVLSLSWMTTKIPLYSGLIAQRQYKQLDGIFSQTLKQSVFMNAFGLICMLVVIYIIRYYHITIIGINLEDRFLSFCPMILMMIPLFINQYVNSWAVYLRCHKREPYLINSIVSGLLCCFSTLLLGKYYGIIGITSGYCFITIVLFFWSYTIYKTKKNEWHAN